jgi:hypothetical protein
MRRYTRLSALLMEERIIGPDEMKSCLLDTQGSTAGLGAILNSQTKHSVVFEPMQRSLSVYFPGGPSETPSWTTVSLSPPASDRPSAADEP